MAINIFRCKNAFIKFIFIFSLFLPETARPAEESSEPAPQPQVPQIIPEYRPAPTEPFVPPSTEEGSDIDVEKYAEEAKKKTDPKEEWISLDFNNVEVSAFTRFVSEITRKNFVISEKFRGKVTVFSPAKVSREQLYDYFLSILDTRGFTVVESLSGKNLYDIVPINEVSIKKSLYVYKVKNGDAEEIIKPLTGLVARAGSQQRKSLKEQNEFEDKISLVADKITNSIFITASERDYEKIKEIIKELDTPEKQVFVEVVIMEVDSDKIEQLGVEFRGTDAFKNFQLNAAGQLQTNGKLTSFGGTNFGGISSASTISGLNDASGLVAGVIDGAFTFGGTQFLNVGVLLRMLLSEADTNVLSTPQVLATDLKPAKIHVGQNVPFIKGTSQTQGGNVQTNIERQDVGITLEFTPKILENKKVNLKLHQKVDSVLESTANTAIATSVGPSTSKREIETSIVVDNLQTVVIGGLIVDRNSTTSSKVPFFGDIPYIGWLFRFKSDRLLKSNLLVFMTPFVIEGKEDLDKILNLRQDTLLSMKGSDDQRRGHMIMDYLQKEGVTPPGS